MPPATLIFSAPNQLWLAALALGAIVLAVLWSYRTSSPTGARWVCAGLKIIGVAALCACLLEPLWSHQRARPGANLFAVLADNSQSLQVKESGDTRSRADALRALLDPQQTHWQAALAENYEVRGFSFDNRLQASRDFSGLTFDGRSTALGALLYPVPGSRRPQRVHSVRYTGRTPVKRGLIAGIP